jgi:hypothetical protein
MVGCLRLFGAVAFLIVCWSLLGTAAERAWGGLDEPPVWSWLLLPVAFIVPIALAGFLFNDRLWSRLKRQSFDDYVAEKEARGKFARESHEATGRALYYEDTGTGCEVYYVESAGKGTVCITGQYSFGPSAPEDLEEGEEPEPRRFPALRFDLVRKPDGDIADIQMTGAVFEPEEIPEPSDAIQKAMAFGPEDGRVFATPTFDELRAMLLSQR